MARYGKTKSYGGHERWMQVKKVGRPKQVWVWDSQWLVYSRAKVPGMTGHWQHYWDATES